MKTFACGDVVPGCDAKLVCSTEDDLMTALSDHAARAHGLTSLPPALVERVRRAAGFEATTGSPGPGAPGRPPAHG